MKIANDLGVLQTLDVPTASISNLLEEAEVINDAESLISILNTSALFEKDQKRFQIGYSLLQEQYDARLSEDTEPAILSSPSTDVMKPDFVSDITYTMFEVQNSIED